MKTISDSARWVRRLSTIHGLLLMPALGAIIFSSGCGKKDNANTTSAPATVGATQQTATQETTTASATATESGNLGPVPPAPTMEPVTTAANNGMSFLQQLNRASLTFKMQNRRNPSTPEELAAFAGVRLPPPPAGKKYAMNNRGYIVLVDASSK